MALSRFISGKAWWCIQRSYINLWGIYNADYKIKRKRSFCHCHKPHLFPSTTIVPWQLTKITVITNWNKMYHLAIVFMWCHYFREIELSKEYVTQFLIFQFQTNINVKLIWKRKNHRQNKRWYIENVCSKRYHRYGLNRYVKSFASQYATTDDIYWLPKYFSLWFVTIVK